MLHVVIGLVLLVLGVFGIISWWTDFGLVLRGLVPFLFLIAGLIAIGSGLIREKLAGSENDSPETE